MRGSRNIVCVKTDLIYLLYLFIFIIFTKKIFKFIYEKIGMLQVAPLELLNF